MIDTERNPATDEPTDQYPPVGYPPMPPVATPPPPSWGPPPGDEPPHRHSFLFQGVALLLAGLVAVVLGAGIGSLRRRGALASQGAAPSGSQGSSGFGNGFGGGQAQTPATAPPSAAAAVSGDAQAVADKVNPGIVDIDTVLGFQQEEAAGTGMILTSNGEILTNNHVIEGATRIAVTVVSTGRTYAGTVVGTDPTADVAVVQLRNASGLTPIPLGNASGLSIGQWVVAIGNAGGQGGAPSIVTGTVQALDQEITASDQDGSGAERLSGLIQTNAPLQGGDSGGPLADAGGKVVGMDTAASSSGFRFRTSGSNEAFAIPIQQALAVAKQIESGKATDLVHIGPPGLLGVEVSADTTGFGSRFSGGGTGNGGTGVPVEAVTSGGPAAHAGIAPGDIIVAVGGTTVDSASALTSLLGTHHPGDHVTVTWLDQSGTRQTATVTLATGPPD